MSNKVLLNKLLLLKLNKAYLDFAKEQGYTFSEALFSDSLYLIEASINANPIKVLFQIGAFGKNQEISKRNEALSILGIFSISLEKIKFDKSEYNSIKSKIKRELSSMIISDEINISPTFPIGLGYAIEDFKKYQKIQYEVNICHTSSELIENSLYGFIKYLNIDYSNRNIAVKNNACFNSFVKKWYYFPSFNNSSVLENYKI